MLAFSSSARDERERPADGLSFHGESWTRTFFNGQKPPARSSRRDKREKLVVSRDAAVSRETVFVTGQVAPGRSFVGQLFEVRNGEEFIDVYTDALMINVSTL